MFLYDIFRLGPIVRFFSIAAQRLSRKLLIYSEDSAYQIARLQLSWRFIEFFLLLPH